MIFHQNQFLIALLLFIVSIGKIQGTTHNGVFFDDDDDGFEHGGMCYYDENCLFACFETDDPADCLNIVYDFSPDFPIADMPYFKLNAEGSTCEPTSNNTKPIGKCCPSCDLEDEASCVGEYGLYVNPDSCKELEGLNYFVSVLPSESRKCYADIGCNANNPDKRAICHREPRRAVTLCLPPSGIEGHLKEHPEDSLGCCSQKEEKSRPKYCNV